MVSPVRAELKVDGAVLVMEFQPYCLVVGKSYFSLSTSNSSKLTSGVSSNVDGPKKRCLGR